MTDSAEPFLLSGGPVGVLLIHGFTGTPREMRYLGEQLHARGLTVLGVRLAGHGSSLAALEQSDWPAWLGSCEEGLAELRSRCTTVHLVGFSLGGALSLLLCRQHPRRISSLVLLATPLWLPLHFRWPLRLLRRLGIHRLWRMVPKLVRGDISDTRQRQDHVASPAIPVSAILSLAQLLEQVRPVVEEIALPTLVIHSVRDHAVPYSCSTELVTRLPRARRITLRRSFHVIPLDQERDQVAREVANFIATRTTPQEEAHAPISALH